MPIINYHYKVKDMPALNKKQRCDICGVEHIGHYMYYSYHPAVSVLCKKCAAQQPRAADASPGSPLKNKRQAAKRR